MFLQKSPDPAPCSVHRCPIRHFFLFFPHVVHLASSRPPPRQRRYVCVLRVRVRGFLPLRETLRYAHDVCIFFRLFFFFEPFFFRSRAPLPLAKLNSIIKQKKKNYRSKSSHPLSRYLYRYTSQPTLVSPGIFPSFASSCPKKPIPAPTSIFP